MSEMTNPPPILEFIRRSEDIFLTVSGATFGPEAYKTIIVQWFAFSLTVSEWKVDQTGEGALRPWQLLHGLAGHSQNRNQYFMFSRSGDKPWVSALEENLEKLVEI